MPFGCKPLALLDLEGELRAKDEGPDGDRRYNEFVAAMAEFNPALGFEYKRDRFIQMRNTIIQLMPVVILSIGAFAWATNPPADPKPLSDRPRLAPLVLEPAEMAALAPSLTPACYPAGERGRTTIRALVTAEFPDGRSDLVSLPVNAACPPVRLTQQNGRVFVPQ